MNKAAPFINHLAPILIPGANIYPPNFPLDAPINRTAGNVRLSLNVNNIVALF